MSKPPATELGSGRGLLHRKEYLMKNSRERAHDLYVALEFEEHEAFVLVTGEIIEIRPTFLKDTPGCFVWQVLDVTHANKGGVIENFDSFNAAVEFVVMVGGWAIEDMAKRGANGGAA